MNVDWAKLGPPIPDGRAMPRMAPFWIERWSIQEQLDGTGHAVLTFTGATVGHKGHVVLMIAAHPTSGEPKSCRILRPSTMEHEMLPVRYVPGIVRDLCITKVLDVFGPPRERPWW